MKALCTALASLLLAGAVFVFGPAPADGQQKSAYKAPRTPDGKPNLQGVWSARNAAWGSLEAHGASYQIRAGHSVIVDPVDGKIPYTAAALKQRDENFKNRREADPLGKCYLPGVPRIMYLPYPFEIYQTPEYVVLLSEFGHATRTIYTNGTGHYAEAEFWMGDSRGKWVGETLEISVAAFNGMTWFDMSGNYGSANLRMTERLTRVADDEMRYEATFTDPDVYTKPWTIRLPLYRHREPNAQIFEYECHVYLEDEGLKTYGKQQ